MKRKIFTIGMLIVALFMFCACTNKSDAIKFKEEYESLNHTKSEKSGKTIRSIKIAKDNPFIYKSDKDIVDAINNEESFIVYFGFNDCPWCRSIVPSLIESAKDNKVEEIYYVDVKEIRDVMVLKDSRLTTETKGTDAYYELTNLLRDVLSDYTITDEEGNSINTGAKRIYAPNIVKVEKGKAVKLISGISEKQTDPYMELTEEIKKDMDEKFNDFFK